MARATCISNQCDASENSRLTPRSATTSTPVTATGSIPLRRCSSPSAITTTYPYIFSIPLSVQRGKAQSTQSLSIEMTFMTEDSFSTHASAVTAANNAYRTRRRSDRSVARNQNATQDEATTARCRTKGKTWINLICQRREVRFDFTYQSKAGQPEAGHQYLYTVPQLD